MSTPDNSKIPNGSEPEPTATPHTPAASDETDILAPQVGVQPAGFDPTDPAAVPSWAAATADPAAPAGFSGPAAGALTSTRRRRWPRVAAAAAIGVGLLGVGGAGGYAIGAAHDGDGDRGGQSEMNYPAQWDGDADGDGRPGGGGGRGGDGDGAPGDAPSDAPSASQDPSGT